MTKARLQSQPGLLCSYFYLSGLEEIVGQESSAWGERYRGFRLRLRRASGPGSDLAERHAEHVDRAVRQGHPSTFDQQSQNQSFKETGLTPMGAGIGRSCGDLREL